MAATAEGPAPLAPAPLASEGPPPLWRQALADLRPFPRRFAMTWRVALLCAIVVAFCMMYEIPEAAISCYLVIYLTKPDAVVNIGTGVGFLFGLFGLMAFLVWIVNLTAGSTLHIMAAIVITSLMLLWLGAASQLGEQGGVAALIIAFLLTLIVKAPFGDAATYAMREAWAMAAAPMALMAAFNLVLGFSPVVLLRDKLRARLTAAAEEAEGRGGETLRTLLREGDAPFAQQATAARVLRLVPRAAAQVLARDVRAGYGLMLAVSALPADLPAPRRAALAAAIRAAEAALAAGEAPTLPDPGPPSRPLADPSLADPRPSGGVPSAPTGPVPRPGSPSADPDADPAERAAWAALGVLAGAPEPEVVPPPKIPFLAPDAFTNPAYSRFAIKTTAAAVICFLIYTGIDWQGIHTAMITCYVAALGTTGETVHKLALRIAGCLVGAALGFGAIFFVIPHIDGIGGLMALVFAGCLVGAWVSTGPERISYAGVQVALAFLLIVVQGFGPSLDFDTGRGRIFGILLGNLVVYVIFTQVWPAPAAADARRRLGDAAAGLAGMARLAPDRRAGAIDGAAAVETLAEEAETRLDLLPFEPRALRPGPEAEAALRAATAEVEALTRSIWLSDADLGAAADRLDRLAARLRAPAAPAPALRDAATPESPAPGSVPSGAPVPDPIAASLARLERAFA